MTTFNFNSSSSQPFGGGSGTSFGGGSTFGGFGQATSQPSFGTTNTLTSSSSGFGTGTFGTGTGGFGTTQSTFGTPQTGTVFGQQQQTQQQPATAFGAQSGTTTFGTATQPTSTTFGTPVSSVSFGSGTTGTGFGTQSSSLFGSTQPQTNTSFGGSGTTFGGQSASGFGSSLGTSTFGTPSTQPSLFGSTQPSSGFGTNQTSAFGGGTQPGTSSWFGGGGAAATSQPSTGFSGFSSGGLFSQQKPSGFSFSSFGQPQQQQQQTLSGQTQQQQQLQQQQLQMPSIHIDEQVAFHHSIFSCLKFGDERDVILANFNYVQACAGEGKGIYHQTAPPVPYNSKNMLFRFKSVGYSFLFNDSNEDGLVVIHIKKPHSKVCEEESQFITALQGMLCKPHIFFKVWGTKAVNEDLTAIILTADDGTTLRRILATDLCGALLQPQFKPQLDNFGIVSVSPKVKPSPEQLKKYLDAPPAGSGLDPRLWKKAQEENPDPLNMVPIPLLGHDALRVRLEAQQKERTQHLERLKLLAYEIGELQNRHANMTAELQQLRRRYVGISHRSIMALLRLIILPKQNLPMLPEEEQFKKEMESLSKQLNSPDHFRGRISELMSCCRMHTAIVERRGPAKYSTDGETLDQIKEFLTIQQGSIQHLVETMKQCKDYVARMSNEMEEHNVKRTTM